MHLLSVKWLCLILYWFSVSTTLTVPNNFSVVATHGCGCSDALSYGFRFKFSLIKLVAFLLFLSILWTTPHVRVDQSKVYWIKFDAQLVCFFVMAPRTSLDRLQTAEPWARLLRESFTLTLAHENICKKGPIAPKIIFQEYSTCLQLGSKTRVFRRS